MSKVTVLNIDGNPLATWWTDVCSAPRFSLPNGDARCPYVIIFEDDQGEVKVTLPTGKGLNNVIREAMLDYKYRKPRP